MKPWPTCTHTQRHKHTHTTSTTTLLLLTQVQKQASSPDGLRLSCHDAPHHCLSLSLLNCNMVLVMWSFRVSLCFVSVFCLSVCLCLCVCVFLMFTHHWLRFTRLCSEQLPTV
ncbi:hypothetical protein M758_5G036500 [Ceratodon purpureus]|nr:hypothetical protein M758_5G036500 [Ceratodon purpureus]